MSLKKPQPQKLWLFVIFVLLSLFVREVKSSQFHAICEIQGDGKNTPFLGEQVQTEGVVTADFDNQSERGFYIQKEACDDNASTSDGIFVYLNEMVDIVDVGDWVTVDGLAEEDFGLTRVNTIPAGVGVVASGHVLPPALDFSPPFNNLESSTYFETRESMRVQAADTVVVGPTDARGYAFVIRAGWGVDRVFHNDPAGTGEVIPISSDGVYQIEPDAQFGDQIFNVEGVLNFTSGDFGIMLTRFPTLIRPNFAHSDDFRRSSSQIMGTSLLPFSIATLNLHNLFDTVDDPATEDSVPSASDYQTKLKKLALTIHDGLGEPLLIAVQEAENNAVLQALANRPEILATYSYLWENSVDFRGIDVALLYQTERVTVLDWEIRQGCTTVVDGLGPDGNGDVQNPVNALTCDTNGDGELDGNRLFSRQPLLAHVEVCEGICGEGGAVRDVWVIAVHLKSKTEDSKTVAYTLPRRLAQAQFVAGLYAEVLGIEPGAEVIVLGDFNDYFDSQTLSLLTGVGLTNLMPRVPHAEAYTYIFQGVSQIIDHVLVSPNLVSPSGMGLFPTIVHLNANFPVSWEGDDAVPRRATDHDPVVVQFLPLPYSIWLPTVTRP